MTRTRYAAHTATTATLALILTATALAATGSWWSLPPLAAAGTTAYLAAGLHLRARREQAVARRLARLRAEEQAWDGIVTQFGKDYTA